MKRQVVGLPSPLPAELQAVADAAGALLVAEADQAETRGEAAAVAQGAVIAAVQAGYPLAQISLSEVSGQDAARGQLRGDVLRRVERTGRRMREAITEHHEAIRRADRVGLSSREIAVAAVVAPATVRGVLARLTSDAAGDGRVNGDSQGAGAAGEHEPPVEQFAGQQ